MKNNSLPNSFRHWNINKIVLWAIVLLAAIYEILITWFYFPHFIAAGIYVVEPLVIWGCLTFVKSNGRDNRTLTALMILEPLLIAAIPYGIYEALIVPLIKLL